MKITPRRMSQRVLLSILQDIGLACGFAAPLAMTGCGTQQAEVRPDALKAARGKVVSIRQGGADHRRQLEIKLDTVDGSQFLDLPKDQVDGKYLVGDDVWLVPSADQSGLEAGEERWQLANSRKDAHGGGVTPVIFMGRPFGPLPVCAPARSSFLAARMPALSHPVPSAVTSSFGGTVRLPSSSMTARGGFGATGAKISSSGGA